ncbi:UNVERIFIED_ORG: hypothetical protein GGI63_004412 [Rhizobium esperanzae]
MSSLAMMCPRSGDWFDAYASVLRYFGTKRWLFANHLKPTIAGIHLAFREKMNPCAGDLLRRALESKKARVMRAFEDMEDWLRGQDLNLRPSGYGPQDDELPSPVEAKLSRQR